LFVSAHAQGFDGVQRGPTLFRVVRVRFTSEGFELDLPEGERLLDALDEQGLASRARVQCRGATCGSCRVRVERGASLLMAAEPGELRVLADLGCTQGERLACQLVCTGDGELELG
jgi:ferredoxin